MWCLKKVTVCARMLRPMPFNLQHDIQPIRWVVKERFHQASNADLGMHDYIETFSMHCCSASGVGAAENLLLVVVHDVLRWQCGSNQDNLWLGLLLPLLACSPQHKVQ